MKQEDTIRLLQECNAGIKMGVASIDEVINRVENENFRTLLFTEKQTHENLGTETSQILYNYGDSGKEPNPVAKTMSWMKTNVKTAVEPGDRTIADLITDGCNMGVKSLHRYLNQYKDAEQNVKDIANRLIQSERNLTEGAAQYL
ncbi:MAG: hypothetical protein K1V97_09185 [Lachnospiraceae bacterium]